MHWAPFYQHMSNLYILLCPVVTNMGGSCMLDKTFIARYVFVIAYSINFISKISLFLDNSFLDTQNKSLPPVKIIPWMSSSSKYLIKSIWMDKTMGKQLISFTKFAHLISKASLISLYSFTSSRRGVIAIFMMKALSHFYLLNLFQVL